MKRSIPWRQLVYHGEVVGFVAAWAVGIVVALAAQQVDEEPRDPEGLASVNGAETERSPGFEKTPG